jgi:hypothetical protein
MGSVLGVRLAARPRRPAFVVSAEVATYHEFEPERIKHMEMIQAVVARLAGNSFLIKGWALTLTGAFLGFGVNKNSSGLAGAAFLPIVVFWLLDTYYLRTERLFRELFTCVRSLDEDIEPFYMAATSKKFLTRVSMDAKSWWKTVLRPTLAWFYVLLIVATVLVVVVICTG